MATCPTGHDQSASDDYCDICGLPVGPPGARPARRAPDARRPPAAAPTPDLPATAGRPNAADALFCEACGYDFTTGTPAGGAPAGHPTAVVEVRRRSTHRPPKHRLWSTGERALEPNATGAEPEVLAALTTAPHGGSGSSGCADRCARRAW